MKTNVHQEYDVKEGQNQIWVVRMNMGEYKGNDLVVGEDIRLDSRIILTCTAWYPAECKVIDIQLNIKKTIFFQNSIICFMIFFQGFTAEVFNSFISYVLNRNMKCIIRFVCFFRWGNANLSKSYAKD